MPRPKTFYRKRISQTGEKVRNVIVIVWMDELLALGWDYYDLVSYLDGLHIPAAVSPIHDKDTWDSQSVLDWCTMRIDPMTGDLDEKYLDQAPYVGMPKKPHVHLLFKGPSQQDAFWWSEIMAGLIPDMKATRWDKCYSVSGTLRYMAHMDSAGKYRYSEWDIVGIAGIDLSVLTLKDDKTKDELANVTYNLVKASNARYYYQLLDAAVDLGDAELVSYLRGSHALWRGYLSSMRQKCRDEEQAAKWKAEQAWRESVGRYGPLDV